MSNFRKAKQLLTNQELKSLKASGILKENEYAFVQGDIVIAEDIRTNSTRVLGKAVEVLVESGSKRVLNG